MNEFNFKDDYINIRKSQANLDFKIEPVKAFIKLVTIKWIIDNKGTLKGQTVQHIYNIMN